MKRICLVKYVSYLFFIIFLFTNKVFAEPFTIFVSGGANFSELHNNQLVAINEVVSNQYITRKQTNTAGAAGVGFNFQVPLHLQPHLKLKLGVASFFTNMDYVKGVQYPFITGGVFDTLNYSFKVKSSAVFVESRFDFSISQFEPFFVLGLGNSWNHFSHYQETPTSSSSSAVPAIPGFSNRTQQALAYEVGMGLQYPFYQDAMHKINYNGAIEYRYFNFGKGALGLMPVQTVNSRLGIANIFTQALLFSVNVSFYG